MPNILFELKQSLSSWKHYITLHILNPNHNPNNNNKWVFKRRRSNVVVIIDRVTPISAFLFYCLLLNHSFQTSPNSSTNLFKNILSVLLLQQQQQQQQQQQSKSTTDNGAYLCTGLGK